MPPIFEGGVTKVEFKNNKLNLKYQYCRSSSSSAVQFSGRKKTHEKIAFLASRSNEHPTGNN
jgi:hypothetical protein